MSLTVQKSATGFETLSSTTTKPIFFFLLLLSPPSSHLSLHSYFKGWVLLWDLKSCRPYMMLSTIVATHIFCIHFICGPWCSQLLPHLLALLIWYGGYVSTISTTSFANLPSCLWHSSGPPLGMSTILTWFYCGNSQLGCSVDWFFGFPKESLIWNAPSKVHSLVPFWFALCFSSLVGFTLLSLRWMTLGFYKFHLSFFFFQLFPFF